MTEKTDDIDKQLRVRRSSIEELLSSFDKITRELF